eukprot:3765888-Alexandrium_andersonii.AAC.1
MGHVESFRASSGALPAVPDLPKRLQRIRNDHDDRIACGRYPSRCNTPPQLRRLLSKDMKQAWLALVVLGVVWVLARRPASVRHQQSCKCSGGRSMPNEVASATAMVVAAVAAVAAPPRCCRRGLLQGVAARSCCS